MGWFKQHKVWSGVLAVVVLIIVIATATSGGSKTKGTASAVSPTTTTQKAVSTSQPPKQATTTIPTKAIPPTTTTTIPPTTTTIPARHVTGKATTLGAGTFTGGRDVPAGLYNVTTAAGQSGNFIVTGTDTYNEILGAAGGAGGVPEVRTQISAGDSIQLSGLATAIFTPVTKPLITNHKNVTLYAGTFTVGEDIGAGRYVATTTAGQSGNFIVTGNDQANEILGGSAANGGVPSVTTDLSVGDVISISGLSTVVMTPTA